MPRCFIVLPGNRIKQAKNRFGSEGRVRFSDPSVIRRQNLVEKHHRKHRSPKVAVTATIAAASSEVIDVVRRLVHFTENFVQSPMANSAPVFQPALDLTTVGQTTGYYPRRAHSHPALQCYRKSLRDIDNVLRGQ